MTDAAFDRVTIEEGSFQHVTRRWPTSTRRRSGRALLPRDLRRGGLPWAEFGTARFYGATFSGGYFNETSYDEAVFERVEAERLYLPT